MWYKVARQLNMSGFGSFPKKGRPADQIATPTEAEKLNQQAVERKRDKPWSQMTIEQRLEFTPNRNGIMGPPGSLPDALLNAERNQPAAIADQHETVHPSGNASRGPAFSDGFPENPDPRSRLFLR